MATIITELTASNPYSSLNNILTPQSVEARFSPTSDYIEYIIKSNTSNLQLVNYAYNGYTFPNNGTVTSNVISSIEINPQKDLIERGLTLGNYNTYYSFYRNELFSSPQNQSFFIKEISPDRTELTLRTTNFNLSEGAITFFKEPINAISAYYKDFYLNFGNNVLVVANNIDYNPATKDILINLYEPLPNDIYVKASLWIVTKIADTLAFNVVSTPDVVQVPMTLSNIKGPNFNLPTKDKINNSTDYINSTQLLNTTLSSSYNQLSSLLAEKGIEINIDYNNFSNFIHFSSAAQRIENFGYKLGLLETYNSEISIINSISGSTSQSFHVSSSTNVLQQKITDLITNFDGYEYFLYYTSGSNAWPKQNTSQPYILYPTTSSQAIAWLGSGVYATSSYGGILSTASRYDEENKDYLYYTIPQYITDDSINQPYILFIQMIGQFFDNIWTYYKDVTNLYQADNRLDYGISKDLVSQALQSFGVNIYQNNFSTEDLYSAFLGYLGNPNTTNTLPVASSSGLEYIKTVVVASDSASIEPLDDVNKEVYKRLYHNLPYLAKTKGTIPGLRALINCFGIPDTVLRISEFGGRDKDTSTYDYFDQQFNYALDTTDGSGIITSSFTLNPSWGAGNNKPESIQLRIKPYIPSDFSIYPTQSLFEISGSVGGNYFTNLTLWYTGSGLTTSSYSGSTVDPYYQYGTLILDTKGDLTITCSIYAPFFDGNWWSIQVDRSGSFGAKPNEGNQTFTLLAGSSGYYDGYDGNQVMHLYSSSIKNTFTWGYSGSNIMFVDYTNLNYNGTELFQGLFQEIRYWATPPNTSSFKDYVMNPQSIDFAGENTYSSKLAARLPLGGDLYTGSNSVHPKVSGSWVTTGSFLVGGGGNPNGFFTDRPKFSTNVEPRFLNSPVIGLRGRVTDKIQIVDSIYPTGSVLSQYIPIAQNFPSSGSESPDVNLLEVAFSPQNEINDDIIDSLGYFNIGEYIGDPRQVSSSATSYPDLNILSNNFFQKYFSTYNLFDYIRLIKYFDNSLFKMIKDFVPARTSLTSGVVIKQHLLERNRYPQPQAYKTQYQNLNVYDSRSSLSSSFNYGEDLTYTGSINTAFITGSTGGTFNEFNNINFTQSWIENYTSSIGVSYISHSSQDEFYNGELPGTEFTITIGELNPDNPFKYPSTIPIYYLPTLYDASRTPVGVFLDANTSPNSGEIYLYKGASYIKINRIDSNGIDQSSLLEQLQSIIINFSGVGNIEAHITSIQEQETYYIYSTGIQIVPNGIVGDVNDYIFTSSIANTPGIPGVGIISKVRNYTTTTGNALSYFNATTGEYTFGDTSNIETRIQVNISNTVDPSTKHYIYKNTTANTYPTFDGSITNISNLLVSMSGNGTMSVILTGSNSIVENTPLAIYTGNDNGLAVTANVTMSIMQYSASYAAPLSLVIFDSSVANFEYNDYNPLLDNADIPQTSTVYMITDYSQNPLVPVNFSGILNGSADRAFVQDSNYSSKSWSNIRYNGSRTNSFKNI
jgi:hypothetical protein